MSAAVRGKVKRINEAGILAKDRRKHSLTVTGNHPLRDLVNHERLHPAIVRRLDDMCRVVEV